MIASLWKIDDKGTQKLMKQFYANLWEKKMNKIDALREAQLWMLRHPRELEALGVKGATRGKPRKLATERAEGDVLDQTDSTDPFFWAAFQLSGDWR